MISVSNLRFAYRGANAPTLADVSFSVAEGIVYGLLGPSGSGKSTTQKILMGLLPGYEGKARVFGAPPAQAGQDFFQRIGVSFELPALYGRLTALENLKFFASLYPKAPLDPHEALAMVDLSEAADKRVEGFSKGMKMRLNLCRALLNDPDLLFLDEPTTGQDPARARRTRELIGQLRGRGKTIFLTTHNMAEAAEICDRVGFLVDGRIALEGTPTDLMRRYGQHRLEVTTRDGESLRYHQFAMAGLASNPEFHALLRSADVVAMHTKEASLDDIFIAVAGGGA